MSLQPSPNVTHSDTFAKATDLLHRFGTVTTAGSEIFRPKDDEEYLDASVVLHTGMGAGILGSRKKGAEGFNKINLIGVESLNVAGFNSNHPFLGENPATLEQRALAILEGLLSQNR